MNYSKTWAEIDLNAISHNIQELKRIIAPEVMLMAVVKANAYGHGDVAVAQYVMEHGADCLGVARLNEAIKLREGNIEAPILIFGYTDPEEVKSIVEHDLTQTIWSYENAEALSRAVRKTGERIKVHLKVDTGMGRLGMMPTNLINSVSEASYDGSIHEVESILHLPGLDLDGIYTHFACADKTDKHYTEVQFDKFMMFLNQLKNAGIEIPLTHAANSAAIIDLPGMHLDMVRAGISIYGLFASESVKRDKIELKPAMTLKTKIIQLKEVPAGFSISYGSTYHTGKQTKIATVPVGYADGFNRLLSNLGYMLIRGHRAPVVGRVCMDLTMLDVGHIPGVSVADEVVIIGQQQGTTISADDVASSLNTINYEIVSTVTDRITRIYIK